MDDVASTWKNEKDRLKEVRRMKVATFKSDVRMFLFKCFWRTLHFTMLARPYSVFMCSNGWYRKFPDGRCQWCGKVHK